MIRFIKSGNEYWTKGLSAFNWLSPTGPMAITAWLVALTVVLPLMVMAFIFERGYSQPFLIEGKVITCAVVVLNMLSALYYLGTSRVSLERRPDEQAVKVVVAGLYLIATAFILSNLSHLFVPVLEWGLGEPTANKVMQIITWSWLVVLMFIVLICTAIVKNIICTLRAKGSLVDAGEPRHEPKEVVWMTVKFTRQWLLLGAAVLSVMQMFAAISLDRGSVTGSDIYYFIGVMVPSVLMLTFVLRGLCDAELLMSTYDSLLDARRARVERDGESAGAAEFVGGSIDSKELEQRIAVVRPDLAQVDAVAKRE